MRSDGTQPHLACGAVYLRALERPDADLLIDWRNDWRTARTLARRAPESHGRADARFEELLRGQGSRHYRFMICRFEDDAAIGDCGLEELDLVNGSAGLGITIGRPEERGHGYGSAALRALLSFAFGMLRLERVWLDVYAENEAARRVYEGVGFVLEGRFRHAAFREGEFIDVDRMAILAAEWRAREEQAREAERAPEEKRAL
jgi:RimJ/RimL family protein N-acetyltransferase